MSVSRSRVAQESDEPPISQRDYFQMQINHLEQVSLMRYTELHEMIDRRLAALQMSIDKSDAALSIRLEGMNEIRGQLATQRADFVTTDRLEGLMTLGQSASKATADKIDVLEAQIATQATLLREQHQKDLDTLRDRMEQGLRSVNADIRSVREVQSTATGSRVTSREFVTYGIAVVAILATLLSRLWH